MKPLLGIIFIIALIVFAIWAASNTQREDAEAIELFAQERNLIVLNVESKFWDLGPFYYKGKTSRIYAVKCSDSRTYWFRFDWNTDVYVENENSIGYTQIK